MDDVIGSYPNGFVPWKGLLMDPGRAERLQTHFTALKAMDTFGAQLAISYLRKTKAIGEDLVTSGVAESADDVNAVLTNGFYWLYGPVNDYV
jgi:hypothetical protein